MHKEMRNVYKLSFRKSEWKILLVRWGGEMGVNIKQDLKEVGCEVEDWIQLAQYRVQ
jgi:hypothetical protein